MELAFIRIGLLAASALILLGLLYVCVKSPLAAAIGQLVAMLCLMFAGAILGTVAAVMLDRPLALLVGAAISTPTVMLCWDSFRRALRDLTPLPPLWSR